MNSVTTIFQLINNFNLNFARLLVLCFFVICGGARNRKHLMFSLQAPYEYPILIIIGLQKVMVYI
ncbi:hypothetical protein PHJA_001023800 [Phtheirospermum japonicum]|uniref:Uncharacterized protein n=1 Tax=Phtheirospermum japonicum TaxID=374723 RepID=A0A830C3F8_9LAMI|nr:hypothetical protein PHJA_001023800 [Phtheirospermum japonicum]